MDLIVLAQFLNHFLNISLTGHEPTENEDRLSKIAESIEKILSKYDIDATTCTQRTICTSVDQAVKNVASGVGSSGEKILDGLTR